MLRDYADIVGRLGAPLWWDDNGCPRYDPFEPQMLGVYDHLAALVEIGCQGCDAKMRVAVSFSVMDAMRMGLVPDDAPPHALVETFLPRPSKDQGSYHYGDPPRHGCPGAGETMNCLDLRILEFWERHGAGEWARVSAEEIGLEDLEAEP